MEIREAQTLADYAGILAIDEVVWNDANAPVAMQKWSDAGAFQVAMVAEGRCHALQLTRIMLYWDTLNFRHVFQVISISGTSALVSHRLRKVKVLVANC